MQTSYRVLHVAKTRLLLFLLTTAFQMSVTPFKIKYFCFLFFSDVSTKRHHNWKKPTIVIPHIYFVRNFASTTVMSISAVCTNFAHVRCRVSHCHYCSYYDFFFPVMPYQVPQRVWASKPDDMCHHWSVCSSSNELLHSESSACLKPSKYIHVFKCFPWFPIN